MFMSRKLNEAAYPKPTSRIKTKRRLSPWRNIDIGLTLVYDNNAIGPDENNEEIQQIARQAMRDDRCKIYEIGGRRIFIEVFNPSLRMLIVGAVHIAQPLSRMASVAGYDVTVIDPRASFATDERFPGITLNGEWPDDGMRDLDPDRRTAIVTLTHDPKLDDPGIEVALKSDAFYIGALEAAKLMRHALNV